MRLKFTLAMLSLALISGCGALNNAMVNRASHAEYYRIFDIKNAGLDSTEMAKIISDGIGRGVSSLNENQPIPSYDEIPQKPGRFKIAQTELTGNAAVFMSMAGIDGFKAVQCQDAVWIGRAHRPHAGTTNGINFTACLFQYKEGYSLNVYADYTKKSGFTIDPVELGSRLGANLAGSPEEFLNETISETLAYIHEKLPQSKISYVEGYPKFSGLPWMKQGDVAQKQ